MQSERLYPGERGFLTKSIGAIFCSTEMITHFIFQESNSFSRMVLLEVSEIQDIGNFVNIITNILFKVRGSKRKR